MTPERINQVGFWLFYLLKMGLFFLAVYLAYHHHTLAAWLSFMGILCFRWVPDGKWTPGPSEKK